MSNITVGDLLPLANYYFLEIWYVDSSTEKLLYDGERLKCPEELKGLYVDIFGPGENDYANRLQIVVNDFNGTLAIEEDDVLEEM